MKEVLDGEDERRKRKRLTDGSRSNSGRESPFSGVPEVAVRSDSIRMIMMMVITMEMMVVVIFAVMQDIECKGEY